MKNSILLITLLCNIVITISAKNVYTYNIVQKNPNIQDEPEKNQYAYPGYTYNFTVNVKDYNGSAIGKFRLKLTNGKFDNDSSTISIFNGETAIAFWQDSANINAEIKVISTSLYEPDRDSLIAGVNQIMYTKIASLKGQTPVLTFNGNPNQAIGNKQQFSATVNEMIYPGIMDTIIGIIRNRRVEFYKWKLPDGWKTTTGISGEFITDTRQVDIIPDYVNRGNITVTGVNYLKSGFSETTSYFADRGFSFINYPISITFGDITPKTFGTTLFNSITYEWSAPSNWQINGQGNLLEAINLNYVTISPSFCEQSDNRVRVRLKKNNEISNWYDFSGYHGVPEPAISTNNETFFESEKTTFTLNNIINENIQSINCTGEGIYYNGNQGADITIIFTEPGVHTMNVSILMNNCNTPKILSKTISVQPSRISISGPTQICDQATYTIDNFPQGATVNWTTSNDLTVASGQNTATVNIARTYDLAINNFIRATINIDGYSFVIEKTGIQIGTVNPLIKIYDARGRYELAPPYYTNMAYTIVAYGDTFSTNPFNYQWVVNQPVESGEPPLLFNGKQYSFIADSVGSYNFSLQYNGECGWSLPTSKAVYFYQNNMLLSFYPNPATDLLTVSVGYEEESISESDISTKKTIYNESYCVELWHEKYGKVKSVVSNESIVQIHLQDLPRGLYAIHLKVKNKIIRKKLLQLM